MNKIVNILLLGMVGILGGIFAMLNWLMGMIFLLINEIVGSRRFKIKLHKLNEIIANEFKEIFNIFYKLKRV